MSHISPEGVFCVNRPWGGVECRCEMNELGTTTCKLRHDISSLDYTNIASNVKYFQNVRPSHGFEPEYIQQEQIPKSLFAKCADFLMMFIFVTKH